MKKEFVKDLIILVADKDWEATMRGLLSRPHSLRIRSIEFDVIRHPDHDPGCRTAASELIRLYQSTHSYSLVLFDREGSGSEDSRGVVEAEVEAQLNKIGWKNRAAAIAIEPEIEQWVWSNSPHVEHGLGWKDTQVGLRNWLVAEGFLITASQLKPERPKEAMRAVLRKCKRPISSAIFQELAEKVSFTRCIDPAFLKLTAKLQEWFLVAEELT